MGYSKLFKNVKKNYFIYIFCTPRTSETDFCENFLIFPTLFQK